MREKHKSHYYEISLSYNGIISIENMKKIMARSIEKKFSKIFLNKLFLEIILSYIMSYQVKIIQFLIYSKY